MTAGRLRASAVGRGRRLARGVRAAAARSFRKKASTHAVLLSSHCLRRRGCQHERDRQRAPSREQRRVEHRGDHFTSMTTIHKDSNSNAATTAQGRRRHHRPLAGAVCATADARATCAAAVRRRAAVADGRTERRDARSTPARTRRSDVESPQVAAAVTHVQVDVDRGDVRQRASAPRPSPPGVVRSTDGPTAYAYDGGGADSRFVRRHGSGVPPRAPQPLRVCRGAEIERGGRRALIVDLGCAYGGGASGFLMAAGDTTMLVGVDADDHALETHDLHTGLCKLMTWAVSPAGVPLPPLLQPQGGP